MKYKGGKTDGVKPNWTAEETQYLSDHWGQISINTIAKNLNRTVNAIVIRATRLGLGPYLEAGEYVVLNQLMLALKNGCAQGFAYTYNQWVEKGLPVKMKKVKKCSFKVIYLDDWWDWAEMNRTIIDFSRLEPGILGKEPAWVDEQRRADIEKSQQYRKTPWTRDEDQLLIQLLKSYKYTYRELSVRLQRTEGAIKRRMVDLKIKERSLKMSNHNPWTTPEEDKLKELYHKGHTPSTMANYIGRSAQAISGKIERLIKEGRLFPRNEFRVSC
jgi:hypothetical protein